MKQMKKHFVWLLCAVFCLANLAACGKKAESSGVDPSTSAYLVQTAGALLQEIGSMTDDDISMIIEQQAAEPGVISGLESYQGLREDLGALVSISDQGTVTEVEDGYEIAIDAVFEKRECEFVLGVDEDMGLMVSVAFNPVYSMGENMTKAALNTVMGMGTVFVVLIFISLLIGCFKYINVFEKKMREKSAPAQAAAPAPAPVPVPVPAAEEEEAADDLELAAVIAAAVTAASEEAVPADGLVVRSIRRVPNGKWKNA